MKPMSCTSWQQLFLADYSVPLNHHQLSQALQLSSGPKGALILTGRSWEEEIPQGLGTSQQINDI